MGAYSGPEVVTSGLVLSLDAGNTRSYPGSGTTWTDLSGNGNNGTLNSGPTFNSANGGNIVFDGVNDHGSCAANPTNILTTLTMEAWFRPVGAPLNGYHVVFQKEGGYSGASVYGLRVENNARIYAMISYDNLVANVYTLYANTSISNNTWYHIASTYDSSYVWRLYVDGVLVNATTLAATPYQNSSEINIGTGDSRYANGNIALVRVYNRAFTEQEVRLNYLSNKSRFLL